MVDGGQPKPLTWSAVEDDGFPIRSWKSTYKKFRQCCTSRGFRQSSGRTYLPGQTRSRPPSSLPSGARSSTFLRLQDTFCYSTAFSMPEAAGVLSSMPKGMGWKAAAVQKLPSATL